MLRIHVLNVGHGDSIVIEFPNREWGVIDSNIVDQQIPALEFLKQQRVEKLSFLCITHPHADHYNGMSSIIEYYKNKIEEVWLFDLDSARLKKYLKDIQQIADTPDAYANLKELSKIAGYLFSKTKKIKTSLQFLRGVMDLRTIGGVRIKCLAPLGKQHSKYISFLASSNCCDNKNNINENLISGIIQLEYQGVKVLLGGDAPLDSWYEVQKKMDRDKIPFSAQAVKISHHGSASAFSERMWSRMTDAKTIATISVGNRYNLPDDSVIRGIAKSRSKMFCTNKGHNCIRTDRGDISSIYDDIPYKAKMALMFQDKTSQLPLMKCMGNCTFDIEDGGVNITPEIPYMCLHNIKVDVETTAELARK